MWWPKNADGSPIKYVYRLIDNEEGSDLKLPRMGKAMRDIFQAETPVDFERVEARQHALKHIAATIWRTGFFCPHHWT